MEVSEGLAALTEADAAVIDVLTALGYSIVKAQRGAGSAARRHRCGRSAAPGAVVVRGMKGSTAGVLRDFGPLGCFFDRMGFVC